jgi:hypothetical protein
MGFNLTNMPKEKPSSFADVKLEDGIHEVTIEKAEYTTSTQGNLMLRVVYKTKREGKFIFDQIMDDPTKQVNMYRLGKLLEALHITLSGVVELKDLPKVIKKGMPLKVAVVTKENGYSNVDINKYDGYYPADEVSRPVTPVVEATPNLDTASSDDDLY